MFDEEHDEADFWSRVPDSRFERLAHQRDRMKQAIEARRAAHAAGRAEPAGVYDVELEDAPVAPRRPARAARPAPAARRRPVSAAHPTARSRQHDATGSIPVVAARAARSWRTATGQVDPTVRRLGVLAALIALGVPVAMAVRTDAAGNRVEPQAAPVAAEVTDQSQVSTTLREVFLPHDPAPSTIDIDALPEAVPVNPDPAPATPRTTQDAPPSATQPAPRTQAKTTKPAPAACTKKYTVVAGDAWLIIAGKVKVTLKALLGANGATVSTALYPGRSICLPANATLPSPKPATTTTVASKPRTTTPPPTTAPYKPTKVYTRAEVEKIIRDVWPDNLEDEAVRIATRESNLVPTAKNYCCYGLFQVYYSVHKTWLAQLGVTNANQLFDPRTNATVALALWNRAGSWAPWRL